METTHLTFGDVVQNARSNGFEIFDPRGLPVGSNLASLLVDEGIPSQPVFVRIRHTPRHQEWGVLAEVVVRDQVYCLWGEGSRLDEVEALMINGESTN
ncbi:MAG: hypothetical protein AB1Z65_13395 [Candidatus Sulfomarinibacteraceae bacterium]